MAAKLYLCALDDASAEMLDSPALLSVIVGDHVKINIIGNNHYKIIKASQELLVYEPSFHPKPSITKGIWLDKERKYLDTILDYSSKDHQSKPRVTEMWLQSFTCVL